MLDESLVESEVRPPEKRILRCPAEGCGKIFRSSPGYRYHLKSHASDPRPHQCRCCMKKFKSANGLKYHLRKSHSIEPVASKAKAAMAAQNNETTNGNEDSESTGDDDCVVPSLPPEQLISKHSPQQHETVLRMNNSISNFKTEQTFKTEPSLSFKTECDVEYKNELPMNRDIDTNNNNYTRHGSYEENDNMCYGSQAETSFRYGSYPEHNNMNMRYGIEGNSSRYSCSDEMDAVRLGCPSYSPKPNYRDQYRDNFRDGLRADFPERRPPIPDYYQHRSIIPQDRYPGVIGYSRSDAQSRYNYPRFDYPVRSYGMSKGDFVKAESFNRHQNQYDNRNEFHKSNDAYFRNPNDFVSKSEPTNIKTGEFFPRSPLTRNSITPKSSSDAFIKPSFARSEFGSRQISNDSEFSHRLEKTNSSPLSNGRTTLQENCHSNDTSKTAEIGNKEIKQESPTAKTSQPKTDINGNSVIETSGILKRRSSKPIPPALVIEPPASSGDEKKDENSKFLPPEVNRLTEFAEFAISPQSPLVQSPFPLTLTPGLLGAGSTPDWMTKSFTRFFFPDKPPSYLNTPGLNSSREDSEGRPATSSLPPSPFIDNVSTPQPFWTTQAWPTPVWHCFIKGCSVKFEGKDEEYRRVEDIACCNSLLNKRNDEANYGLNGLKVVDIKEIKDVVNNSKLTKDRVMITFDSTSPGEARLYAKCPVDHLFLVKHKGWSSPRPNEAMTRYGIPFQTLQKGDICIPSAQHKETNSNTLSPLVSCTEAFPFSSGETSAATALSAMAKRQEMSLEKPPPISLMSTSSMSASSPAAESVSSTTTATYSPTEPFPRDVPYSMVLPMNDQSTTRHTPQPDIQPQEIRPPTKRVKRKRKTNNLEEKQRRPMNGFMLFAKKMRVELTQKFPGKDNRAISKVLGEQWRALSTSERQGFAAKAKIMADERRKINPDCWKRKRKKSKGCEAEPEFENIRIKKENSPGPCHSEQSIFSMA